MIKLIYSLLFALVLCFHLNASLVHAEEILFEENFSSGLEKWRALRDDGRYWHIVNQTLEAIIPTGSTVTELVPILNPQNYIKNYTFEMDYTALQGVDKNISFGVIDTQNWYELHFVSHGSYVLRVKNGTVVWSQNFPFVLQNGVTQRINLAFINGRIILLINGHPILDTIDSTFENNFGTFALKATTGSIFPTKVRFDNILVTKILDTPQFDGKNLRVEVIKQTNPEWSDQEYDTASVWAPILGAGSTIKEWGCNLVSMVMLLKYHGITTFADGTDITPKSLNTWLLDNNGFYSYPPSGNINRKSISQLSAEISKTQHTPKLEFLYVGKNLLETAITEIDKGNPVVLELEGHFVIADGYTEDKSDLYIKDPAYDVNKLSEHPLPLKSVRLYTPSYTDLSYISTITGTAVKTTLVGSDSFSEYSEQLKQFTTLPTTIFNPKLNILDIPKPDSAKYTLYFENTSSTQQLVTVQTFNKSGLPQEFTFKIKPGKHTFDLNYKKEGTSTLKAQELIVFTYKDFRKTIKQLSDSKLIKQEYFGKVLIQLIKPADQLSLKNQKKLLQVIKTIISTAPKSLITRPAQSLLLDQVKLLMVNIK